MSIYKHPVRVDSATQAILCPTCSISQNMEAPVGSYFLRFSPAVFLHAYTLLGNNPQRFGSDLSLYISTTNTYFSRRSSISTGFVSLAGISDADAKKRLAEDLGVALSSLFMVESFGVTWDSIAQIPQNSKLSKKRPDFEGFDGGGCRHLFESKGTTVLGGVEAALSKAIEQVKKYPEAAFTKLAIVSYLNADERFFPSQTFVVDPPSLPDNIPPTKRVAQLLHGEKILQFVGLPQTASVYLKSLAKMLRSEIAEGAPVSGVHKGSDISSMLNMEIDKLGLKERMVGGVVFLGRDVRLEDVGVSVFMGVPRKHLNSLSMLSVLEVSDAQQDVDATESRSFFSDGTCLIVDRG